MPAKLVLRFPSTVLTQWNMCRSLGFFPPTTKAWCEQPAFVTARKQSKPSEMTEPPGLRLSLAQAPINGYFE